MSDRASVQSAEIAPPGVTRHERRQIRRVGVALQIRLRNADAQDGDFEEVRTTLNTSRKAVYFFTPLNGYYKGMKLRITFPYDAQASSNLEQDAEVIRVHRRDTGFGVAVSLSPEGQKANSSTYAHAPVIQLAPQNTSPSAERRCAKRTPFVAPVELIDVRSGSRIKARVADLSLHGCYVDTLNPLPVGCAVRLRIQKANESVELLASVSSQHPGSGMGLEFNEITPEQRGSLRNWLAGANPLTQVEFTSPRSSEKRRRAADSEVDETYAVRLIQMLLRKGILSKSEATELLRDPEE
jgi:PilZ domain